MIIVLEEEIGTTELVEEVIEYYEVADFDVPDGITESIFENAGELISATADNTPAIVSAPSATGQILRADLGETVKMKWETVNLESFTLTAVKTSDYTAINNDHVLVDCDSGSVIVTLPATPSAGNKVRVTCVSWASGYRVKIARNSSLINGETNDRLYDLTGEGQSILFEYSGADAGWAVTDDSRHPRRKLAENTTFYVRTDGADTNDGRANTSGAAFLTLQGAWDYIKRNIDAAGYNVTIKVADGTYTGGLSIYDGLPGAATLVIEGNTSSPSSCVISTTSASCFLFYSVKTRLSIKGFKTVTTTSGYHLYVDATPYIILGEWEFGACAAPYSHIVAYWGSFIYFNKNYRISGGAYTHLNGFGSSFYQYALTITLTGTPAFSYYIYLNSPCGFYGVGNTYSGSATGSRYYIDGLCLLRSGVTLPGNVAGTAVNGAVYV